MFEIFACLAICLFMLFMVIGLCLGLYVVFIYIVSVYNRRVEQKKKLKRMGEFNV